MTTLAPERILYLIAPYYPEPTPSLVEQLGVYLDLLLHWNARLNLTAIRTPEEIVQRHFGESLFLASHLPIAAATMLDLGSGAGFPGLPLQLARPALNVTLAESQHKKASFLREVVRELKLPTRIWADRAEKLPKAQPFDIVALRAVDKPDQALIVARTLLASHGTLAHLTSEAGRTGLRLEQGVSEARFLPMPHRP